MGAGAFPGQCGRIILPGKGGRGPIFMPIGSFSSLSGFELVVPLSRLALSVLGRLPKIGKGELVFTTDGKRSFSGYSKAKAKFDVASGVKGWTLHDLRRTARSLTSRAGVSADIAERCLGHVIAGVRGTYDRYAYFDEKKRAFRGAGRSG